MMEGRVRGTRGCDVCPVTLRLRCLGCVWLSRVAAFVRESSPLALRCTDVAETLGPRGICAVINFECEMRA